MPDEPSAAPDPASEAEMFENTMRASGRKDGHYDLAQVVGLP